MSLSQHELQFVGTINAILASAQMSRHALKSFAEVPGSAEVAQVFGEAMDEGYCPVVLRQLAKAQCGASRNSGSLSEKLDDHLREIAKSHVTAHTRNVDGKLVQVKEHEVASKRAKKLKSRALEAHQNPKGWNEKPDRMSKHFARTSDAYTASKAAAKATDDAKGDTWDGHQKAEVAHAKAVWAHDHLHAHGATEDQRQEHAEMAKKHEGLRQYHRDAWKAKEHFGEMKGEKDEPKKESEDHEAHKAHQDAQFKASAAAHKATNAPASYKERADLHRDAAAKWKDASEAAKKDKTLDGESASKTYEMIHKHHLQTAQKHDEAHEKTKGKA